MTPHLYTHASQEHYGECCQLAWRIRLLRSDHPCNCFARASICQLVLHAFLYQEEIRHTDTNSKLLHSGYNIFGKKYRNKHNINQSQTIHITKAEIDMNMTHGSVHQSSGQTRSTISKRIDTSARQKNKYTS